MTCIFQARIHLLSILIGMAMLASPLRAQDDPAADYTKIHEGMSKLAPLVGKWRVVAIWQDDKTENDGTWDIRWALDETYLELRAEMHRKGDPSHHHGWVAFITYNPRTQQYDNTYFYTRWAGRITETGTYDEKTQEYRSKGLVPLEDGVHDENVRNIYYLNNPNLIVNDHYSQKSNEPVERLQLRFTLTREPAGDDRH